MGRRLLLVLALLIVTGSAAGAASDVPFRADARAITPPKGIPDLSRMALLAADFPGSRVTRQKYVKADDPFVASYEREFGRLSVRVGTKKLFALESDVDLATSAADAALFMAAIPLGLALLDPKVIAAQASSGSVRPTSVRVGKLVKLRAGDEAVELTIRFGTKVGEVRAILVFLRVNRAIDVVVAVGAPRTAIGVAEAGALSRLAAAHTHDGLVPINTRPPAVSGTAVAGQTLTADAGTWSNKPTAFAYRWQRCDATGAACADIAGATARTYSVAGADAGSTLRAAVTATNAIGSGRAFSTATAVVAGLPVSTAPPVISGTAAADQTLTATTGTWTGGPTGFAYQWQRCDAAGTGCADIAGATAQTYAVGAADAGSTLRVAVTATNASGSAVAVSAPTAFVSG